MKTSTVVGLAVLAGLGVAAYYLYTKSQAAAGTTGSMTPAQAASLVSAGTSLFSSLVSDIGGVFSGSGSSGSGYGSNVGTASPISAQSQLDAYQAYGAQTAADTAAAADDQYYFDQGGA